MPDETTTAAPAVTRANDGTQLTAFRLRDRIYRAACAKVPRFRFKPAKEDDEEDLYLIDVFFKIAVDETDVANSDHYGHAFRRRTPKPMEPVDESEGDSDAMLLLPATGDRAVINETAAQFSLHVRDLVSDETLRLEATEGVVLRDLIPDPRANPARPVAFLIVEARGCPYVLGSYPWPMRMFHVAIVHKGDTAGLFEGEMHLRRQQQTPERVLSMAADEDDGPPDVSASSTEPEPANG